MKRNEIFALIFWAAFTALLLIILLGCGKDSDGFVRYEVPAGQHYSEVKGGIKPPNVYNKHNITFKFKTNESWRWWGLPGGHSKVGGIGQKGFIEEGWHENSCRLSYQSNGDADKMYHILGMQVYADGMPFTLNIDTIDMPDYEVEYTCKIDRIGNEWHLTVNGKTGVLPAGKKYRFGTRLYPYVGGSYTLSTVWKASIKWK